MGLEDGVTADKRLVLGQMTEQNGGAEKLRVCIPELAERLAGYRRWKQRESMVEIWKDKYVADAVRRSGANDQFDGTGVEFEACKKECFPSAAGGLFLLRPGM